MAIVITNDQYYHDIADAIRGKNGQTIQYLPEEMAPAITEIETNSSSIIVYAPTDSAVTVQRGTETPKTAVEKNGVWTFKGCDIGGWKVYATLNGLEFEETVDITEEGQLMRYEVEVSYRLTLYSPGNTHDDISGGWAGYAYKSSTSGSNPVTPTLNLNNEYMKLTVSNAYSTGSAFPGNKIDVTNYNKLVFDVIGLQKPETIALGLADKKENNFNWITYALPSSSDIIPKTYTIDIFNITGKYYVVFACSGNDSGKSVSVSGIRLE